eukprot:gene17816-biopygen10977
MTAMFKKCAKAAADKIVFYKEEFHSTVRAFKVLECISLLDPRNHAACKNQTYEAMADSLRGLWQSLVDVAEWKRYCKAKLQILGDMPPGASDVLKWWQRTSVNDAFPTIAKFVQYRVQNPFPSTCSFWSFAVLTVVAMLPSSSADVERSFSLLGHVQTKDRLNMRDDTFEWLVFLYTNSEFVITGERERFNAGDMIAFADWSSRAFRQIASKLGKS